MKLRIFGATLLFVVGTVVNSAESDKKLVVGVYYETLCPDSKRFVKNQLYPVKKSSLGEHFDVELIPYGKAITKPTSAGSYDFTCQHGPPECDGNKMHACALKYINSTETKLEFVYCSMSKKNPPKALEECAEKVSIGTEEISKCAEGTEGSELLAKNGEKTHSLRPKLYFVPTITYNGEYTSENLQNSQDSFKTVVCNELKKSGVKISCNGGIRISSSSATWLLFPILVFQLIKSGI